MLVFSRSNSTLEVDPLTWAKIMEFFTEAGWEPNIPTYRLLQTPSITVDKKSALEFAAAGRAVQEEALKDPLSAYSRIDFDMAMFSDIIEFASQGEFKVSQK